jgi:Kef-type K+ transport system membrane component KefB
MATSLFVEFSVLLIIVIAFSFLMRLLRQPLIIGYILTGILISPAFLNLSQSQESLALFSEMGVAVLLFIVGLNLNPSVIREVGKVAVVTGLGQVTFTFLLGFGVMKLLGFPTAVALYISAGLTMSSTIIIMKLLSDKGELETLHGRISTGFLLVQDLVAVAMMIMVTSLAQGGTTSLLMKTALEGFGAIFLVIFLSYAFMPAITKKVASSQELLLLFSLTWCFALASLFYRAGFSLEIGALLAGISLATSHYRHEVSARLRPLRDFFIVMFFILLGSRMLFEEVLAHIFPILLLSAFVLLGNPLIMLLIMRFLGYSTQTAFLTGLAVAQISEFSFILVALGVQVGHIPAEAASLIALIGIITLTVSTYFIQYSHQLYQRLAGFLLIFDKIGKVPVQMAAMGRKPHDILLFGCNRIGFELLHSLKKMQKRFLVVDYNPDTIRKLQHMGIECMYGDAGNTETLHEINIRTAKMVLSTVPDSDVNMLLISQIRQQNKNALILVVSNQLHDALKLYEAGASYVIMPHFLAGSHTSMMIEEFMFNINKFLSEKATHVSYLHKRKFDTEHLH